LREGGFFHLEKTMVSVLHEELGYKVEKRKYETPKIKNKSQLSVGE